MPNLKFASLATLELLAFNAQKIGGHANLTPLPFRKFFSGVMSGLYLGSCVPNFKFASLAILELLAFSAQKIKGHVTLPLLLCIALDSQKTGLKIRSGLTLLKLNRDFQCLTQLLTNADLLPSNISQLITPAI